MRLAFHEEALDDLQGIYEWIVEDNPAAAVGVVTRIFERLEVLLIPELVHIGRPGRARGTYELLEDPYIIVYEIHDNRGEVVVLSIAHGRRHRG